jgi:1-aminocyclopropane-1-carboxylate deaminase/D-cysteine desulfhydrase-like pyridoxal-dependent ACC family enzyme
VHEGKGVLDPFDLTRKIRAALAPCRLGSWPTPLEPASALGDANGLLGLWIKREDASSTDYGGSKVRGLEFLFAGAAPGTVFVTLGGTGSTHCLATAVHAAALAHRTVLAQFPQPSTESARAVAAACQRAATRVVRTRWRALLPLAVARAWFMARGLGLPRWIPGGGAHPRGVIGQFLAGLELARQLADAPDAIVVPLGSGGTAAGLALAMRALGWSTRVVAVRVAPAVVANRWRVTGLVRGAARLLARLDPSLEVSDAVSVIVVHGIGAGYGHPSAAGEVARALAATHGVILDSTYGAKAFAALPTLAARGFRRVVFWHTFAWPHVLERSA